MSILMNSNFQWVLLSTILLGMASGMFGCLAYWKRQSLMSDALAHAALPGVVLAYMIIQQKNFMMIIIGAGLTALLGAWMIQRIKSSSRIKEDTAMGLILAVFFGGGIMLLTIANQSGGGNQAGLDQFIFGQAAVMVRSDITLMSVLAALVIFTLVIGFKEWKLLLFDANFAKGLGLPVKSMNALYVIVLVLTIVIGIQAVGVVLMSALFIIPSVSARYWTHSFKSMVILSGLIGAFSGALGTTISAFGSGWPTGPFIVVTSGVVFLISLFFGSKKGLIVEYFTLRKQKKSWNDKWETPTSIQQWEEAKG